MKTLTKLERLLSDADIASCVHFALVTSIANRKDGLFTGDSEGCQEIQGTYFVRCSRYGVKINASYYNQQGANGLVHHVRLSVVCPMFSMANETFEFIQIDGKGLGLSSVSLANSLRMDYRGVHFRKDLGSYELNKKMSDKLDSFFYDICKCRTTAGHVLVQPVFVTNELHNLFFIMNDGAPLTGKKPY